MKKSALIALVAVGASLAGCSTPTSYLFTVTDRGSTRSIEGATLEITPEAERTPTIRASTDGRGESVVVMPRDQRCYLVVTFDGTTDRYLVRSELVPAWNAPTEAIDDPNGPLRFIAGAPSSRPMPSWSVRLLRLK